MDEADVVRINSNLVTVPASVVDAQGRAVVDLKLEDFELRVDGQPKEISDLGRSETPVRMVMLFDNSMSLSSAREFEKQAAVKFFRTVLRPIDTAAVYSIWTVPILAQPFTGDVRTLVRTIERFGNPEDGATALFDTVAQAAEYLRAYQGRKVMVIVSDGADTLSNMDFLTSLKRVITSDVQVYAVQTGQLESANLYNLAAHQRLQEYASQTGGAVYIPRSAGDLDYAFAQISADLSQQYILSYYPQDDRNDGRFRTISLRVKTRPDVRVRARKGYYDRAGQNRRQPFLPAEQQQPAVTQPEPRTTDNTAVQSSSTNSSGTERTEQPSLTNTGSSINRRGNGLSSAVGPPGPDDDTDRPEPPANTQSTNRNQTPPASSDERAQAPSRSTSPPPQQQQTPPPAAQSPAPNRTTTPETSRPQNQQPQSQQQSPSQPTAPKRPLSGGVLNGKALSLPKPLYPPAAKSMGAAGTVIIEVLIDESGKVISARALSGPEILQAVCVQAAKLAKFSPTTLSGQPVQVLGTIHYTFVR